MPRALTPSQENYLEWIYRLAAQGPVRVRALARKLGVRLPSVSRAISDLVKAGLVRHESYGDISLTQAGEEAGRAIVRRDECLTRFLVEILDMDPVAADPEVHRLEHFVGGDLLWRLETLVSFALSSEGWMKRLKHRLTSQAPLHIESASYRVGETLIHPGRASEKSEY